MTDLWPKKKKNRTREVLFQSRNSRGKTPHAVTDIIARGVSQEVSTVCLMDLKGVQKRMLNNHVTHRRLFGFHLKILDSLAQLSGQNEFLFLQAEISRIYIYYSADKTLTAHDLYTEAHY